MTEKHDENAGTRTVFTKIFRHVFIVWIIAVIIAVITSIPLASIFIIRTIEEERSELLPSTIATYMLTTVIALYIIQALTAVWMSLKPQKIKVVEIHDRYKVILLNGSSILRWTIDDAIRNSGPWIFLIVAIFLPVMLALIPDVVLISSRDPDIKIPTDESFLSEGEFRITSIMYYLCLSLIAVLITLEASILMNLKDVAGIWIGMVLVTMILDIVSFLVLYGMEDPLGKWKGLGFEVAGAQYFFLLAYFCTISSFLTIMFARASREMVFETLVIEGAESGKGTTPKN